MKSRDLINYFKGHNFDKELPLVESGVISLHWSNWDQLISKMKEDISNDAYQSALHFIHSNFEDYKKRRVWLSNKKTSIEASIFDVYSFFRDPRIRQLWNDLNQDTLISFDGPHGPYTRFQDLRWFDFSIYKTFAFEKLLKSTNMTPRSFRINVSIPLYCNLNEGIDGPIQLLITQMSSEGVLVQVEGKAQLDKILAMGDEIQLQNNLHKLISLKHQDVEEIDRRMDKRYFLLENANESCVAIIKKELFIPLTNETPLRFGNDERIYFFLRYEDLEMPDKMKIKEASIDILKSFEKLAYTALKKAI